MKTLLIALLLLGSLSPAATLRVALAANVSYAMPELIRAFGTHYPSTKVETTVGGSGKLAAQIRNGAPYDLFLSANTAYPQALYDAGVTTDAPAVYAQGALVLLSNTPRAMTRGLALLNDPSIQHIAVANPRTAPYGKAAMEALTASGLLEAVRPKLIYGESIAQTVTYTLHGADIGLVTKSVLYAPTMRHFKEGIHWSDLNATLYHPIDQGMVVIKQTPHRVEAKALYDFLLSDEARAIFARYGYRLP